MRFFTEYKDYNSKENINKNILALGNYLNYHLIENHYGFTINFFKIKFLNSPPSSKQLKSTTNSVVQFWVMVEVPCDFQNNNEVNITDFLQAIELSKIAARNINKINIKKELDYDTDKLLNDLNNLPLPKTDEEIESWVTISEGIEKEIKLKETNGLIKAWKEHPRPLKKRIAGIRTYPAKDIDRKIAWGKFNEVFDNLINQAKMKSPGYIEIYVRFARTIEEAKQVIACEDWNRYTYCEIDMEKYERADLSEKQKIMFNAYKSALLLIADFDHLDKKALMSIIDVVEKDGVDTELTLISKETKKYSVSVNFYCDYKDDKTIFYLKVIDKTSNRIEKIEIGSFIHYKVFRTLNKIKITGDLIEIFGKKKRWFENHEMKECIPVNYTFKIDEILTHN